MTGSADAPPNPVHRRTRGLRLAEPLVAEFPPPLSRHQHGHRHFDFAHPVPRTHAQLQRVLPSQQPLVVFPRHLADVDAVDGEHVARQVAQRDSAFARTKATIQSPSTFCVARTTSEPLASTAVCRSRVPVTRGNWMVTMPPPTFVS